MTRRSPRCARSPPLIPSIAASSYANNLVGRALLDKGQPRAAAEALLANYRNNPEGRARARQPVLSRPGADEARPAGPGVQGLCASSTPSMARRSAPTSRSSKRTPRPRRSAADRVAKAEPRDDREPRSGAGRALRRAISTRCRARTTRIGIAVSGGPDSLALLLLAAAARPAGRGGDRRPCASGRKPGRGGDGRRRLCERLGVPHAILTVEWPEQARDRDPGAGARTSAIALLGEWARGAGPSSARHRRIMPTTRPRPCSCGWSRRRRAAASPGCAASRRCRARSSPCFARCSAGAGPSSSNLCRDAGVTPVDDPSNDDEQFERVRVRHALAGADWLDPRRGRAQRRQSRRRPTPRSNGRRSRNGSAAVTSGAGQIVYRPGAAPQEIRRRIVRRAILTLATEGQGDASRPPLDQLLGALATGRRGNASRRPVQRRHRVALRQGAPAQGLTRLHARCQALIVIGADAPILRRRARCAPEEER